MCMSDVRLRLFLNLKLSALRTDMMDSLQRRGTHHDRHTMTSSPRLLWDMVATSDRRAGWDWAEHAATRAHWKLATHTHACMHTLRGMSLSRPKYTHKCCSSLSRINFQHWPSLNVSCCLYKARARKPSVSSSFGNLKSSRLTFLVHLNSSEHALKCKWRIQKTTQNQGNPLYKSLLPEKTMGMME